MSASLTLAQICSRVRSCAIRNKLGALSEATTVCPMFTRRSMIVPFTGDLMTRVILVRLRLLESRPRLGDRGIGHVDIGLGRFVGCLGRRPDRLGRWRSWRTSFWPVRSRRSRLLSVAWALTTLALALSRLALARSNCALYIESSM